VSIILKFEPLLTNTSDFSRQYTLNYKKSGTVIPLSKLQAPGASLKDLWVLATEQQGLYLQQKDISQRILNLTTVVEYPNLQGHGSNSDDESEGDEVSPIPPLFLEK